MPDAAAQREFRAREFLRFLAARAGRARPRPPPPPPPLVVRRPPLQRTFQSSALAPPAPLPPSALVAQSHAVSSSAKRPRETEPGRAPPAKCARGLETSPTNVALPGAASWVPPSSAGPAETPVAFRRARAGPSSAGRRGARAAPLAPAPGLTPARPFRCAVCAMAFARKGVWKKHVQMVHEHQRKFECSRCPLSFGLKSDLKRHTQSVHLKARPFACPVCAASFGRRSDLKRHTVSLHPAAAQAAASGTSAAPQTLPSPLSARFTPSTTPSATPQPSPVSPRRARPLRLPQMPGQSAARPRSVSPPDSGMRRLALTLPPQEPQALPISSPPSAAASLGQHAPLLPSPQAGGTPLPLPPLRSRPTGRSQSRSPPLPQPPPS